MTENKILKSSKLIDSLTYMSNDIAKDIKCAINSEEYNISLKEIIYINKLYNQKKLKDLIKFSTKLKKIGINPYFTKSKSTFNKEQTDFLDYLNSCLNKKIENGFSSFLFNLSNESIETDNIIDFIMLSNKKILLKEKDFNLFRNIIKECEKNKEETIILLSYIKNIHLSHFFMLIDSFIKNIKKSEIYMGKEKRGFYKRSIDIFISFLPMQDIKTIQNSPFHNTIENYIKGISYNGENEKQKEINSHFIQSAYLKRVFNNSDINYNGYIINPSKYSEKNPYCKKLFYGSSIPTESIEKRLFIVENYFTEYLNDLENNLCKRTFFKEESFYDINVLKPTEVKLLFLLNYLRTPSFVEDLYFSYLYFLKNEEIEIMKAGPEIISKEISENLSHLEFRSFFKIWQLSYLEEFLKMLGEKNIIFSAEKILVTILNKLQLRYRNCFKTRFNQKFFNIVFCKFKSFLNDNYHFLTLNYSIDKCSDNLFICKTSNDDDIFENDKKIKIAYFPINYNAILLIVNEDENYKNIINSFEVNKENIMINKRNIFTVDVIKKGSNHDGK